MFECVRWGLPVSVHQADDVGLVAQLSLDLCHLSRLHLKTYLHFMEDTKLKFVKLFSEFRKQCQNGI